MPLLAIKIGGGNGITQAAHLDIVDFIDKQSLGKIGDKKFLALNVDMTGFKMSFAEFRALITRPRFSIDLVDGKELITIVHKCAIALDLDLLPNFSSETKDAINTAAELTIDMREITRLDKVMAMSDLLGAVYDKQTTELMNNIIRT